MFSAFALQQGIAKVKAEGRTDIRYILYDDEDNESVQTVTVEQAEIIVAYLAKRDMLYFAGLDEAGLPLFGSSFEPEEPMTWDKLRNDPK